MRLASLVPTLPALALLGLSTAFADGFVAIRIEVGDKLEYRAVAADQFDQVKADAEAAAKPDKAKVKKIGTYDTQEEAEKATRAEADKEAYFTCWRCKGEGTVTPPMNFGKPGAGGAGMGGGARGAGGGGAGGGEPKPQTCSVCRGKKRIKSDGYVIYRVQLGDMWSYLLLRNGMFEWIQEEMKNGPAAQLGAMGGAQGGADKIKIAKVETYRPGQFDEARAKYDELKAAADGQAGFMAELSFPGVEIPRVEWPAEFFSK